MTQREESFLSIFKNRFVVLTILIIGSVIVFLPLNEYSLHLGNDYNIFAILMIIPAMFIVVITEFLP